MRRAPPVVPTLFHGDLAGRSSAEVVTLGPEEVRHLQALRLGPEDEVRLTDGGGVAWRVVLQRAGPRQVQATLLEPLESPRPIPVELAFAVAGKAHTLWLVEKATEFQVRRLQPVEFACSRSVADAARSSGFWDKARRRAVAAMKQSRGAWLPEIGDIETLEDFGARRESEEGERKVRIVLDRSGPPLGGVLGGWEGRANATLLVGPEGGVESRERESLRKRGFLPARLGEATLRFETAAVAAVAVAVQHLEGLKEPSPE